jgi:hypothetical protein
MAVVPLVVAAELYRDGLAAPVLFGARCWLSAAWPDREAFNGGRGAIATPP